MAEQNRYWSVEECGWVPSPAVVDAVANVGGRPPESSAGVPVQRDAGAPAPDGSPVETPVDSRLV